MMITIAEAAHARLEAAERTLESLGYTYSGGSSMGGVWEPPKASEGGSVDE